jgi:hypothetical protein
MNAEHTRQSAMEHSQSADLAGKKSYPKMLALTALNVEEEVLKISKDHVSA